MSSFLPEPLNLGLAGSSGIGKTKNVLESLKYHPQEDIWYLGGMSPKSLIHERGVFELKKASKARALYTCLISTVKRI